MRFINWLTVLDFCQFETFNSNHSKTFTTIIPSTNKTERNTSAKWWPSGLAELHTTVHIYDWAFVRTFWLYIHRNCVGRCFRKCLHFLECAIRLVSVALSSIFFFLLSICSFSMHFTHNSTLIPLMKQYAWRKCAKFPS